MCQSLIRESMVEASEVSVRSRLRSDIRHCAPAATAHVQRTRSPVRVQEDNISVSFLNKEGKLA